MSCPATRRRRGTHHDQLSEEKIRELGRRWVDAEVSGDVATLDALTTDDFTLVGPVGFVLDKEQWLAPRGEQEPPS